MEKLKSPNGVRSFAENISGLVGGVLTFESALATGLGWVSSAVAGLIGFVAVRGVARRV